MGVPDTRSNLKIKFDWKKLLRTDAKKHTHNFTQITNKKSRLPRSPPNIKQYVYIKGPYTDL